MNDGESVLDFARRQRIGLEEAVFAAGKSAAQLSAILHKAAQRGASLLLTRLSEAQLAALPDHQRERLDYDPVSRTAVFGRAAEATDPLPGDPLVAIVTAGTSDIPAGREAERTLRYHGQAATLFADIGVAGLWRLLQRIDEIAAHPVVIVAAGMDAALPSVVGGLIGSAIVAVPTSVGYGVAAGGAAALNAALASCAPGITVVNVDNGYGAACAALRMLNAFRLIQPSPVAQGGAPWNAAAC